VGALLVLGACAGPVAVHRPQAEVPGSQGAVSVPAHGPEPLASPGPTVGAKELTPTEAAATETKGPRAATVANAKSASRVERKIPLPFPLELKCKKPITAFCTVGKCATLEDFAKVFNCEHIGLERCGEYRALTMIAPLLGFVALFDAQRKLVAGERWTDSGDFCDGRAREAWYGPKIRCTPSGVFEPWCPSRAP
jgi:hypothetical protein